MDERIKKYIFDSYNQLKLIETGFANFRYDNSFYTLLADGQNLCKSFCDEKNWSITFVEKNATACYILKASNSGEAIAKARMLLPDSFSKTPFSCTEVDSLSQSK